MAEDTREQKKTQADALPVDFGRALGAVWRTYLRNAGTVVDDLPGGPRGYQVLSIAATTACTNQARIAEQLGLDRTVMTYLIDDLEKAGLVTRRPDPADRRARQVVLTDQGEKTLAAASGRIDHIERSLLGGLGDEDAALFRDLLIRVASAGPVDVDVDPCGDPPAIC